jgi:DNA processing protein
MHPIPLSQPNLAHENMVDVLRLIRTLNVGPITFFTLMRRFGSAAAALEALPGLSVRGGRRNPLVATPRETALREIELTESYGAKLVLYGAPQYPKLLLGISDPPPLITVSGNSGLWENKDSIAIVGARNASANGCQFGQHIAQELGENGLSVVSGLARGIDTFVHKGSLATGTVAIIAGGIDTIYPPENAGLYQQIREHGAIISEQAFGALPYSGSFPGRNRIIAGMSLGTVVVEASPKSGSLITARFATENGREVFAVPGSPMDPRSKGCNQLIRQGATMVESVMDILDSIAHYRRPSLQEERPSAIAPPQEKLAATEREMSDARQLLVEKMGATPVSVDTLMEQCDVIPATVLAVLLELELAGRLKRAAGNQVYLIERLEALG